jgi:hypothetical protein
MVEVTENLSAKPKPTEQNHNLDAVRLAQIPANDKPQPQNPIEGDKIVITPLPQARNATVQSHVHINEGKNGKPEDYTIRPTTGVDNTGVCLKGGVLGYCSNERQLDPQGVNSAANVGEYGIATQSLIMSGSKALQNVLPQSSDLLKETALKKMENLTKDKNDPLRPIVHLEAPREKAPEVPKEDPATPRLKESLADAANSILKDKVTPVEVVNGKGGFSQRTTVSSDVGYVVTDMNVPKLEDKKQLQLMFFNITKYDAKDIPEKLKDVANTLDLNARAARALELCLKDPDPKFQKECALAIVAKQLEHYGVRIDQVIWQKAAKEEQDAAKIRQMPTDQFVRNRMEEYLAEKARERRGEKPVNPVVMQQPGEGFTAAEKAEFLRILPTVISKPDLARVSELIESQKGRLSF